MHYHRFAAWALGGVLVLAPPAAGHGVALTAIRLAGRSLSSPPPLTVVLSLER